MCSVSAFGQCFSVVLPNICACWGTEFVVFSQLTAVLQKEKKRTGKLSTQRNEKSIFNYSVKARLGTISARLRISSMKWFDILNTESVPNNARGILYLCFSDAIQLLTLCGSEFLYVVVPCVRVSYFIAYMQCSPFSCQ